MCEYDSRTQPVTGVLGLIDALVTSMVSARIYHSSHPRAIAGRDEVMHQLETLSEGGDVTFGIVDGLIVFRGEAAPGASMAARRLVDALARCDAGQVRFSNDVGAADIDALLQVLDDRSARTLEEANRQLVQRGGVHVRLHEPLDRARGESNAEKPAAIGDDEVGPMRIYQSVANVLQRAAIDVCRGDQFSLDSARTGVEKALQRLGTDPGAMFRTARYEQYDAFTFGHSIRVCFLALNFAKHFCDDEVLLTRIGTAALVHDIGKARIPYEVLHAPGKLSPEQRAEMEKHAQLGAEVLLEASDADPMSIAAAFGHHRSLQGGYPLCPGGSTVSAITKLIKICDIYEALTANRPYKRPMSPRRAYRVMLSMGPTLDRQLLHQFISVNGLHPTGTEIELSDSRIAHVERQTSDMMRPIVSVEGATQDLRDRGVTVVDRG